MSKDFGEAAARKRLDMLVGEWNTKMSGAPPLSSYGHTRIEWMTDAPLLFVRSTIELPEAPTNVSVIGCDGKSDSYTMLYTDERDVQRIMKMTLDDAGTWTLSRDGEPFSQRFTGRFSEDKRTITGRWEMNRDGEWQTDFEMVYTKVG